MAIAFAIVSCNACCSLVTSSCEMTAVGLFGCFRLSSFWPVASRRSRGTEFDARNVLRIQGTAGDEPCKLQHFLLANMAFKWSCLYEGAEDVGRESTYFDSSWGTYLYKILAKDSPSPSQLEWRTGIHSVGCRVLENWRQTFISVTRVAQNMLFSEDYRGSKQPSRQVEVAKVKSAPLT